MGGQEFKGGDAAEVSPVMAIRGPRKVGVVVTKVFSDEKARAVCEYDIIFCKTLFSSCWGGDKKDGAGAKLEKKYWTMPR